MQGELNVLDPSGHTVVRWDPTNADDVKTAREVFETMKDKGYSAFTMGDNGKRVDRFDPAAEKIMLIPQLVGG